MNQRKSKSGRPRSSHKRCLTERRSPRAASLAELPAAMWIMFVMVFVPMLVLASLVLKVAFFNTVAKDAAHAASRAKIFQYSGNPPAGSPPDSVTSAYTTALAAANALGITIATPADVQTVIVANKISDPNVSTVYTGMLANGTLDTTSATGNVYSIRVTVQGQLSPLIPFPSTV